MKFYQYYSECVLKEVVVVTTLVQYTNAEKCSKLEFYSLTNTKTRTGPSTA